MVVVLPTSIQSELLVERETEMGYHIVNVHLKNGEIVPDAVVLTGYAIVDVRYSDTIPFCAEDIDHLEVTHNKWNKTEDAYNKALSESGK